MTVAGNEQQAGTEQRAEAQRLPTKYCDIVMKGGITSGIVYPAAVCELARSFRFKSVGGTSAGAIAAAATAAAEFGRSSGLDSFAILKQLPDRLGKPADGKPSLLFALFQPEPKTRPMFNTLLGFLGADKGKGWRVLFAALRNFALAGLLGALPGVLLLIVVLWQSENWLLTGWGALCAVLMLVIGCLLGVAAAFAWIALVEIPANQYGLCTGYQPTQQDRPPALTNWLSAQLNQLAGLPEEGDPLTFGHLWGSRDAEPQDRLVNLVMMTTNLSHGQPYRLPFDKDIFYFSPQEFAKYFPPNVVNWMASHPRREAEAEDPLVDGKQLVALPVAADLPVVVATRMSLSFPILLSAVPLYTVTGVVDREMGSLETAAEALGRRTAPPADQAPLKTDVQTAGKSLVMRKCWFSDGGITSNFPIHFFDAPLPRWPTFAINLRSFPPDVKPSADPAENVRMARSNNDEIGPFWSFYEPSGGLGRLLAFLGAIVNTARTWSDETQLPLPGNRDRIVHIQFGEQEGGLNLKMEAEQIDSLSKRGQAAGDMLVQRFANPGPDVVMSWDNHRWLRYRTMMALLEGTLRQLGPHLETREYDPSNYFDLIDQALAPTWTAYKWSGAAQQKFARRTTRGLVRLNKCWQVRGQTYGNDAPKPRPALRVLPRI